MTLLEDNLHGPLPIGQICLKSYMPRKKINSSGLHWTGFFSSPTFNSLFLFSIFSAVLMFCSMGTGVNVVQFFPLSFHSFFFFDISNLLWPFYG